MKVPDHAINQYKFKKHKNDEQQEIFQQFSFSNPHKEMLKQPNMGFIVSQLLIKEYMLKQTIAVVSTTSKTDLGKEAEVKV